MLYKYTSIKCGFCLSLLLDGVCMFEVIIVRFELGVYWLIWVGFDLMFCVMIPELLFFGLY